MDYENGYVQAWRGRVGFHHWSSNEYVVDLRKLILLPKLYNLPPECFSRIS